MLTKRLLAITLLLPLVAISATAHAGSTITDKSYWPSEAGQSAQTRVAQNPAKISVSAIELTIAVAHGVAEKHRPSQPLHIDAYQNGGSIPWP